MSSKKLIQTFPKLFGKTSDGRNKQWQIEVFEYSDGSACYEQTYGMVGGKLQVEPRMITKGKNIGKKNETTVVDQALAEAESRFKKKLDQNYTETIGEVGSNLLPMLAQNYRKRAHNIIWPAYCQPKLNGVRCLAKKIDENTIRYTSRKNKVYTAIDHLSPSLLEMMKVGQIFDGEIFTKELTFQEITSAVKKQGPNSPKLQFWVYDIVDPESTFTSRLASYNEEIPTNHNLIVKVSTTLASSEQEMKDLHDAYVQEDYEGIMVRNKTGLYVMDKRSADLQKYKDFLDEEFEIIGGKESKGTETGCVVFKCITKDGKEFDVRPRGVKAQRQKWYSELTNIIGKELTVRYQNLSDDGIPIFPVGIIIRDYE